MIQHFTYGAIDQTNYYPDVSFIQNYSGNIEEPITGDPNWAPQSAVSTDWSVASAVVGDWSKQEDM